MTYSIRTSDRKTFRQCRQKWDFTSPIRHNLEPIRTDSNLSFGIAIHVGLESYYDPDFWNQPDEVKTNRAVMSFLDSRAEQRKAERDAMDPVQQEEFDELTELGKGMLSYYGQWAPIHDRFTPVEVEYKFQIPIKIPAGLHVSSLFNRLDGFSSDRNDNLMYLGTPVMYEGRIDVLLRDEDDALWIMDHKTTSRLDSGTAHLDVDPQVASYAWAAQQITGDYVAGVIYNQLRKSVPQAPRVLKSGKLSQDKSQNTTYELYVDELESRGLNHYEYEEFLDYLRENPNEYVRRLQLHRSKTELNRQGELIFMEAMEMVGEPAIYPNPHFLECNRCPFKTPCLIAQEKGDVEFILNDQMMYKERE